MATTSPITIGTRSITSLGHELETDEHSFGWLQDSSAILNNPEALQKQMNKDGYLYIRNFFPREIILDARKALLETLDKKGIFEPDHDLNDGILKDGVSPTLEPDAWKNQPLLNRVVFGPEVKEFYTAFLGGTIRHFDNIWLRTMGLGRGSAPHCDIVYMGRGTHRLYTAWIPYGWWAYSSGKVPSPSGSFPALS